MRTAVYGAALIAILLCGLAALTVYENVKKNPLRDWFTDLDVTVDLGPAEDLEADLAFDEAEHVKALAPKLTFVPDGFTCLECHENPTLPLTVWCAGCSQAAWEANVGPSEPIERGQR